MFNKQFLTSLLLLLLLLSSGFIFATSANLANAEPARKMPETPKFCGKQFSKNCIDKRDYLKKQYQDRIKKVEMQGKNPNSEEAKLAKVIKLRERSLLEECDFDAAKMKNKAAADTYLYKCHVATYNKLINKIDANFKAQPQPNPQNPQKPAPMAKPMDKRMDKQMDRKY